jgi:hypothetical protein
MAGPANTTGSQLHRGIFSGGAKPQVVPERPVDFFEIFVPTFRVSQINRFVGCKIFDKVITALFGRSYYATSFIRGAIIFPPIAHNSYTSILGAIATAVINNNKPFRANE